MRSYKSTSLYINSRYRLNIINDVKINRVIVSTKSFKEQD